MALLILSDYYGSKQVKGLLGDSASEKGESITILYKFSVVIAERTIKSQPIYSNPERFSKQAGFRGGLPLPETIYQPFIGSLPSKH